MLKRGAITVSMFSSSTVFAGGRKRLRRRRVGTIRLGNKRRGVLPGVKAGDPVGCHGGSPSNAEEYPHGYGS
ncbi:hypothetical protein OIU84_011999 [Salix udensis]|uniref:Uncharacterized protein n=1 Tax=Salix udensis TaxID=889485 RepID=A0AAD6NT72_9ROSI|nr:hypothetical protein OIU84_011999 [Salix udensis]